MTSQRRPRPPLKLHSISELPERFTMNLGTETPTSIVRPSITPTVDDWGKVGLVVNSNVPARSRNWRSLSWDGTRQKGISRFQKERFDTDCAIWCAVSLQFIDIRCSSFAIASTLLSTLEKRSAVARHSVMPIWQT